MIGDCGRLCSGKQTNSEEINAKHHDHQGHHGHHGHQGHQDHQVLQGHHGHHGHQGHQDHHGPKYPHSPPESHQ